MKKCVFYLTAAVALTCTSCGNGLYSVSGKVTYKGQPAAGAAVFFQRQGADLMNEPMIMGLVQQDGSFSVVCGDKGAGTSRQIRRSDRMETVVQSTEGSGRSNAPDKLGGRYADPKNPRLHAEIKAATNDLPPFDLTD